MKTPVFVINLDRRADRMKLMADRLVGIDFTRISAVDGSKLSEQDWKGEVSPDAVYPLSANEIACIRSHRLIARKMVDEKIPHACVLEDDAVLSRDFRKFVSNSSWLPEQAGIIKIETMKERLWLSRKKQLVCGRSLRELRSTHSGTAGYIISQGGAVKMLRLLSRPDRAIDDLMFDYALRSGALGAVLQMSPALCVQEFVYSKKSSPSDISHSRSALRASVRTRPEGGRKLLREMKRPFRQAWEKHRYIREIKQVVPFN